MEDTENLDMDLLESVRQKMQNIEELQEGKGKGKKSDNKKSDTKKTDEKDQAPADEQDEDPAVKIDNPINPELNSSDSEEDEEGEGVTNESVRESVQSLLGDDFSDDFKLKAVTIFEAAVKEQVNKIEESLKKEYAEKIAKAEENFDIKLVEETNRIDENLSEEINGYLTLMSEEWMRKNELAVQAGIKAELVESFIDGMKTLFEEHYVDLPEEKLDMVAKLQEEKKALEAIISESKTATDAITEKYHSVLRENIISESAKDFTDLDFARFKTLTEDFQFDYEDTFRKKVDIIKKAFFETKAEKSVQKKDQLMESFIPAAPIIEEKELFSDPVDDKMSAYLKFLNKK